MSRPLALALLLTSGCWGAPFTSVDTAASSGVSDLASDGAEPPGVDAGPARPDTAPDAGVVPEPDAGVDASPDPLPAPDAGVDAYMAPEQVPDAAPPVCVPISGAVACAEQCGGGVGDGCGGIWACPPCPPPDAAPVVCEASTCPACPFFTPCCVDATKCGCSLGGTCQ